MLEPFCQLESDTLIDMNIAVTFENKRPLLDTCQTLTFSKKKYREPSPVWNHYLMPNETARAFCFTLNNPQEEINWEAIPNARYAIYQEEIGSQGTTHYQGYVELNEPMRRSTLNTFLPGAHLERRRGTREQARDYCQKTSTRAPGCEPVIYGDWIRGPGTRSDLIECKRMLDNGATDQQLAEAHFSAYIRNFRGFERYRALLAKPRDWKTGVTVYYGEPGTGKTSQALEEAGTEAFWKSPSGLWWDGYHGQPNIVIDDFYGGMPFTNLVRLLDRYPLTLETKGGHVAFIGRHIWITSNQHPSKWYNSERCDSGAIMRRITKLVRFSVETGKSYEIVPPPSPEY